MQTQKQAADLNFYINVHYLSEFQADFLMKSLAQDCIYFPLHT